MGEGGGGGGRNDVVEAHCYVATTGKLILMSIYAAESINQ